jgi:hypothetical protein
MVLELTHSTRQIDQHKAINTNDEWYAQYSMRSNVCFCTKVSSFSFLSDPKNSSTRFQISCATGQNWPISFENGTASEARCHVRVIKKTTPSSHVAVFFMLKKKKIYYTWIVSSHTSFNDWSCWCTQQKKHFGQMLRPAGFQITHLFGMPCDGLNEFFLMQSTVNIRRLVWIRKDKLVSDGCQHTTVGQTRLPHWPESGRISNVSAHDPKDKVTILVRCCDNVSFRWRRCEMQNRVRNACSIRSFLFTYWSVFWSDTVHDVNSNRSDFTLSSCSLPCFSQLRQPH